MSDKVESRPISAVVGLVIAIIALVLSAVPIVNNFAFVLAIISLVFGIVAMRASKKNNKTGRKMAVTVIILSLLAGAIVLASQAFYTDTIDKAVDQAQESIDIATGKKTDELLGKEVDVTLGKIEIVTEDFNTSSSLPVKVTNKNSQAKSYSIQIEAVDANGSRIEEDSIYANNLGGNQSQDFKAFQYVSTDKYEALKSAQFKIVTVSQY